MGSEGCWGPDFRVKVREQRSRGLIKQGGLCHKKRGGAQRELDLRPTCFNSEDTEAKSWKVTYRVTQPTHG